MCRMTRSALITRRRLIGGTLLAAGAAGLAGFDPARAAGLLATPRQTSGPFYPKEIPLDSDSDLVQVAGRERPSAGEVTHLFGRVLDLEGQPLAGSQVEIWQCDAAGFYHHPGDRGGRADPDFQGFGRATADGEGRCRFRTIKPVAYPGRTPHIHILVARDGELRLVTQIYIKDHSLNSRDGIFNSLRDPAARQALAVDFQAAPEIETGTLKARFDLVLA